MSAQFFSFFPEVKPQNSKYYLIDLIKYSYEVSYCTSHHVYLSTIKNKIFYFLQSIWFPSNPFNFPMDY